MNYGRREYWKKEYISFPKTEQKSMSPIRDKKSIINNYHPFIHFNISQERF